MREVVSVLIVSIVTMLFVVMVTDYITYGAYVAVVFMRNIFKSHVGTGL